MCFHDWSKWGDPFAVDVTREMGEFGDSETVRETVQTRSCSKCKKIESRTVHSGEAVK